MNWQHVLECIYGSMPAKPPEVWGVTLHLLIHVKYDMRRPTCCIKCRTSASLGCCMHALCSLCWWLSQIRYRSQVFWLCCYSSRICWSQTNFIEAMENTIVCDEVVKKYPQLIRQMCVDAKGRHVVPLLKTLT